MKSHQYRFGILIAALITLISAAQGITQDTATPPPPPPPEEGQIVIRSGNVRALGFVQFMDGNNKVVTGAPYSAQATTLTTQTQNDGNQIIRNEASQVYRDSQGRTRHEHNLSKVGPWSASSTPHQMIAINDPVAGVHYMFDPEEKTAMKMPLRPPGGQQVACTPDGACTKRAWKAGGPGPSASEPDQQPQTTSESLGTQVIEGVTAEGTRVTETIDAGKIGNTKPITIVTERWYSPQLQTYVLTKRNDPMFGETVHKLTNISTAEPSPELFQVPADYEVKEGKAGLRAFGYQPAHE